MSDFPSMLREHWKGVVLVGLAFFLITSVVLKFWLGPMIFMQNRDAGEKIVESEMNADSAIDNYEWFKQQKRDIEAKRRQMNNTKAQINRMHENYEGGPEDWPRDVRKKHERLHQQLLGQQNMHNQMVADYNARSDMQNRAAFKGKLPYDMEKKFYVGDAR